MVTFTAAIVVPVAGPVLAIGADITSPFHYAPERAAVNMIPVPLSNALVPFVAPAQSIYMFWFYMMSCERF